MPTYKVVFSTGRDGPLTVEAGKVKYDGTAMRLERDDGTLVAVIPKENVLYVQEVSARNFTE